MKGVRYRFFFFYFLYLYILFFSLFEKGWEETPQSRRVVEREWKCRRGEESWKWGRIDKCKGKKRLVMERGRGEGEKLYASHRPHRVTQTASHGRAQRLKQSVLNCLSRRQPLRARLKIILSKDLTVYIVLIVEFIVRFSNISMWRICIFIFSFCSLVVYDNFLFFN